RDADGDDVVSIVRDRGGESAAFEAESAHEADADPAGAEMPLEDGDLGEPRGVRRLDERLGDDLAGDDADHAGCARRGQIESSGPRLRAAEPSRMRSHMPARRRSRPSSSSRASWSERIPAAA